MVATLGHAGDGNLHPTFVVPRGDVEAGARARLAFDAVLDAARELGGTVTGEHGVGALKRSALTAELDPVAAALHRTIKQALDPAGHPQPGQGPPALTAARQARPSCSRSGSCPWAAGR